MTPRTERAAVALVAVAVALAAALEWAAIQFLVILIIA